MAGAEDRFKDTVFDDPGLASNPALPKGARQVILGSQAQAAEGGDPRFYNSIFDAANEGGLSAVGTSWYGGRNMESTENGWSTAFMSEAFNQMNAYVNQAAEEQKGSVFYDWLDPNKNDKATGVAAWNDPTRRIDKNGEQGSVEKGDIFNNGKWVGNLYKDFDEKTANLMLLEFTEGGKVKQKAFDGDDRDDAIAAEVDSIVRKNSAAIESAADVEDFGEAVEERQGDLQKGWGQNATLATATGLGAGIGAGIGSVVPVAGTAVGTGIGAGIGAAAFGIGAWLNRDQITEQQARALEVTSQAKQKYGAAAGFTTGLTEFSGVGLRLISPLSNTTQGLYDLRKGDLGDGISEWYEFDSDGNRQPGKIWRAADFTGMFGDSLLQFSSPVGIAAYMTGTGGNIVGKTGTMVATGWGENKSAGWDDRTASFNEYTGKKEWAAALGSVGIDAIQFGFAGAIAKAGSAGRAAFATEASTPTRVNTIRNAIDSKLPTWTLPKVEGATYKIVAGQRQLVDDATGAVIETTKKTVAGRTFTVNTADDTAIAARNSYTMLAPSEFTKWPAVSWRARNRASLSNGGVGVDDYYKAAKELTGGNRFASAILNGWAEGWEEAAHAVLEPMSFGASATRDEIIESFLGGAAAGAGMSMGTISAPVSKRQVLKYRTQVLSSMRHNGVEMTEEELDGFTNEQLKKMAMASPEEAKQIAASWAVVQKLQRVDRDRTSTLGGIAFEDAMRSAHAKDRAKANPNNDGVLQLAGREGNLIFDADTGRLESFEFGAYVGGVSAWQMVDMIRDRSEGLAVQVKDATRLREELREQLADAGELDESARTRLNQELDELTLRIEDLDGVRKVSRAIAEQLLALYEKMRQEETRAEVEAVIDQMNELVMSAYEGRMLDEAGQLLTGRVQELSRRAVEMQTVRYPLMNKGSNLLLVPQASKAMTEGDAHGVVSVHQSLLKAPGADHDGDTLSMQNFVYIPPEELRALRSGAQYLASTMKEMADGTTMEWTTVEVDAPDNEQSTMDLFAESLRSNPTGTEYAAADNALTNLETDLTARYAPYFDAGVLREIFRDFRDRVKAGNKEARIELAEALVNLKPGAILQVAEDNGANPEIPWLMQRISLEWERFQQAWAAQAEELEFTEKDVPRDLPAPKAHMRHLAVAEAATAGQTLAMGTRGIDPTRDSQKVHYSLFRAAIENDGNLTTEQFNELVRLYSVLGANKSQSEMDRVQGRNAVQQRVLVWLQEILEQDIVAEDFEGPGAILLLANAKVPDIKVDVVGGERIVTQGEPITMLQLLLRRSVEVERVEFSDTLEADEAMTRKLNGLDRLSRLDAKDKSKSTTAQKALAEVFGSVQFHKLLGDSAKYLGLQKTMNQVIAEMALTNDRSRQQQLYRWRRKAPYVMHRALPDPPYSIDTLVSGEVSPYKMVVDAIAAAANASPSNHARRSQTAQTQFEKGIARQHKMVQSYRDMHNLSALDAKDILEAMFQNDPRFASIVADLIPEAARAGAFAQINGEVFAAPWVMDMLVAPPEQASLMYFIHPKLAEWNQMGGRIDLNDDTERDTDEAAELPHVREYSQIKSRFLQTIYALAAQDNSYELDRLILTIKSHLGQGGTLDKFMAVFNADPNWTKGETEYVPFDDDVASYETGTNEAWTANLPGQKQREAIAEFNKRTKILSKTLAKAAAMTETENNMLSDMDSFLRTGRDTNGARQNMAKVGISRGNVARYGDLLGPKARARMTAKMMEGIIRMHDKGKIDAAIAPVGDYLITADEFGVKQSVFQTLDGLTSLDFDDIATNPSKLVEGPLRVMNSDGSSFILDLSTDRGSLDALMNPMTRDFAKAVLFPLYRDVSSSGDSLQHYQRVPNRDAAERGENGYFLGSLLDDVNFNSLFDEEGSRLNLEQSHTMISLAEAGARKEALSNGQKEARDAAYFPVQQAINDFVVAYTHGPGFSSLNKDGVRDELFTDIANALLLASTLDPASSKRVQESLKAALKARFERNHTALKALLDGEIDKAADAVMYVDAYTSSFMRRHAELEQRLIEPGLTEAERLEIVDQQNLLIDVIQDRMRSLDALSQDNLVPDVVNMYTMTGNHDADAVRKTEILRLLAPSNRMGRFQSQSTKLVEKALRVFSDPDFDYTDTKAFKKEEWEQLGGYAAAVYLAELNGRTGSSVELTPIVLGPEGAEVSKYFDVSWSYLVDGIFQENALKGFRDLATQAGWTTNLTIDQIADSIESTLFSPAKLGGWTELIPSESLKAKKVMSQATVGLAIPVGGLLPEDIAAYHGASRRTARPMFPTTDMATTRTIGLDVDGSPVWDKDDVFKLNNHFASRMVFTGVDSYGQPIEIDLLAETASVWMGDKTVEDSGYKVMNLQRVNDYIARLFDENKIMVGGGQITVEYFDQDTKPFDRRWANNVYFEGVGREGAFSTQDSLITEMVSSNSGISKEAQQEPLNLATKGGTGYQATEISPLDFTLGLETDPVIASVLRDKALHMLQKEYDIGGLHIGDANSLYKLQLMRHVVVGTDENGDKQVMWAEQAISWQTANGNARIDSAEFPLRDARLVALSEPVAQQLLGEPGDRGIPGVTTRPVLNVADMDPFPELTPERLREIGVTRLGEMSSIEESDFAGILALDPHTGPGKERKPGLSQWKRKITQLQSEQVSLRSAREEHLTRINSINATGVEALRKMLAAEGLGQMFVKLGIPWNNLRDVNELELSKSIMEALARLLEVHPNSLVVRHVQGQGAKPSDGLYSETITKTDGESLKPHQRLGYEDVVLLELDSFVNEAGGNYDLAYKNAKDVARWYADRGVTIALAADSGSISLRSDLAAWMASGALGYEPMATSRHFFTPISPETHRNKTRTALESQLTATRVFTGDSLILTHRSDRYGDASSENASWWDLRPEQPVHTADSLTLIPTQVSSNKRGRGRRLGSYGMPVKGVGNSDQLGAMKAQALDMLRDPKTREFILKNMPDPKGVPTYKVNKRGKVDPGIRSNSDALDQLERTLASDKYPIEVGQQAMIGDIVPLLGTDGSILFQRLGFQAPSEKLMREQLDAPVSDEPGAPLANMTFSPGKLESAWTVKPPFTITKVNPDIIGTNIQVRYDLATYSKLVFEGNGWKTITVPRPMHMQPPDLPLGANGIRVNNFAGRKAMDSKQAHEGAVGDFGWLFALTGVTFKREMVEHFLGSSSPDPDAFAAEWAKVEMFLSKIGRTDWGYSASEIADYLSASSHMAMFGAELNAVAEEVFGKGYRLKGSTQLNKNDPMERLAHVLMASLMAPRVRLEHVIETSGLMGLDTLTGDQQIRLMPQLFTDALNDLNYPKLREYLFAKAQAMLPKDSNGRSPYVIGPDFRIHMDMLNPKTGKVERVPGSLQINLAWMAEENTVNYVQAGIRKTRQDVSQYNAFVTSQTVRGRVAVDKPGDNVERLISREGIDDLDDPADFFHLMRDVPRGISDGSYSPTMRKTRLQLLYMNRAAEKVNAYRNKISQEDWSEEEKQRYNKLVTDILTTLNLPAGYADEVDYMVRQFSGTPGRLASQVGIDGEFDLPPDAAIQVADLILTNVREYRIPTHSGVVSLPDATIMSAIYSENLDAAKPWAPRTKPKSVIGRQKLAKGWDQWVMATFGQVRETEGLFSPQWGLDLDGFMHTWQDAIEDFDVPVSMSTLIDLKLMDPEGNKVLASMDPGKEATMVDPAIFEGMNVTLDVLVGMEATYKQEAAEGTDESSLAKRLEKHAEWLRTKQLPKAKQVSVKDYVEEGVWYTHSRRDTHNFFHNVVNACVMQRLARPDLWTSAVIEVWVRNTIEEATNLATGGSLGNKGRLLSAISSSRAGEALSLPKTTYTPGQIDKIQKLSEAMGDDDRWIALLYDEVMYQNLVEPGRGWLGGKLSKGAAWSARVTSDPHFGMMAKNVAKRYLEAALEYLNATDNAIPLDLFLSEMNKDPLWLMKQSDSGRVGGRFSNPRGDKFNAHTAGLNRIAQVRSMKPTLVSKLIMKPIDSMVLHPSFSVNMLGHLLKIPFMFTRFNANALMTMTGLGGFDQMFAMMIDGRQNSWLGRASAMARGEQYDPTVHGRINMTDVIEGVDLSRAFARGAITQTGLMGLGLMAGGLGLSGEDEETKRRRRLAAAYNMPLYMDPRRAENDFLYADAMFLDFLPDNLEMMLPGTDDGRAAIVPHWIIRQFTSPIMGMERFFNTGDTRHIRWGFEDSLGVLPNSVVRLYQEAAMTGEMLDTAAKKSSQYDTLQAQQATNNLLLNMVGMYERALLENGFVNSLRSGADTYNRNPWVMPEIEDGEIVRDPLTQAPIPSTKRSKYVDEDGNKKEGYAPRKAGGLDGALLHQYAENNLSAAVLLSIVTGQLTTDSSFYRNNMVPSQGSETLPEIDKAKAEAFLVARLHGLAKKGEGLETVSEYELTNVFMDQARAHYNATGEWTDEAIIKAMAVEKLKQFGPNNEGGFSVLDDEGKEILTKAGAGSVLHSIANGLIEPGDPSLVGVSIPVKMRKEIQEEWSEELIQDGIDMGLPEKVAKQRANRIFYGDKYNDPNATGLWHVIWDDRIPWSTKVTYNQLNTTHAMGPDGKPWATPFKRTQIAQAFGIPLPHTMHSPSRGLGQDARGKVTDPVFGINLGVHALERVESNEKLEPPKDKPKAFDKTYEPSDAETGKKGWVNYPKRKWTNYPKRSYGRRSYGGGYSSSYGGSSYFTRMNPLPDNVTPYGSGAPFINTSNPIIRRANIRRERVWSERGRLKQWQ